MGYDTMRVIVNIFCATQKFSHILGFLFSSVLGNACAPYKQPQQKNCKGRYRVYFKIISQVKCKQKKTHQKLCHSTTFFVFHNTQKTICLSCERSRTNFKNKMKKKISLYIQRFAENLYKSMQQCSIFIKRQFITIN